jgi:hypothetical protein
MPAAPRWAAYLAVMMLALLLRYTVAKVVEHCAYRRLRSKLAARMQVAEGEAGMFVGLSPEPRPLVYDGWWDWDVGFLTLAADRLDYRGERARFTLWREQVTEIQVDKGAPHWSDPHWVYVSWRDDESGREGRFPLIVPRVQSPWRLPAQVCEVYRTLTAWKNGEFRGAPSNAPEWGLPIFSAEAGASPPNQLPQMAAMIAVSGLCLSLLARFPVGSEATFYFALVWSVNVLFDLYGHKLAPMPRVSVAR